MVIGLSVLILCGLTIALSMLFGRELRRRTVMENELARQAHTDALTGLPNRRHFEHTLAVAQQMGKPLSLLVVDADHFKAINDVRGHVVGDEVLRSLAQCLSASLTRPNDLACRVGGEEFAVLLPDTDRASALRIAAKIHEAVASLTVRAAGILPGAVTVSIGAATSSATGIADGDLYDRADSALYEAKAAGRNRTRCFQSFGGNTALARPSLRLVGA